MRDVSLGFIAFLFNESRSARALHVSRQSFSVAAASQWADERIKKCWQKMEEKSLQIPNVPEIYFILANVHFFVIAPMDRYDQTRGK